MNVVVGPAPLLWPLVQESPKVETAYNNSMVFCGTSKRSVTYSLYERRYKIGWRAAAGRGRLRTGFCGPRLKGLCPTMDVRRLR